MRRGILSLLCLAYAGSQSRDERGGAEPAARTVQIPKPEIPVLVYYPADRMWQSAYGQQGEIGFSDGSNNNALADIPDNFQSRIACDKDLLTIHKPWISDEQIAQQVSPTTCRQLLSQTSIRLKTSSKQKDYQQRNFFPVPATQNWRGKTVDVTTSSRLGTHGHSLSPCCRQAECPSVCLQHAEPKKCHLEVFTISTLVVYEESFRADFIRFFTGQSITTEGGAFLIPRFRIPCDYCPLANCITNCSNGEYATGYAEISVRRCNKRHTLARHAA